MKKILILIIVLLASALYFHDELKQIISPPEVTIDEKELLERKGVYYKKFSEVPFTGKVTGKWKGSLEDGKKGGSWVKFRSNGQLSEKESYADGKKDSPTIRYLPNGEIRNTGNYNKNGKKEGEWVKFGSNGQRDKENYKNGERHGEWVSYGDDGKLQWRSNWKNGKKEGTWVSYNSAGTADKKHTGTFKNGEKISWD